MKDLDFHFAVSDPENLIFETPAYAHFGDQVAYLNLIRSLNLPKFQLNIGTWDEALKMTRLYFDERLLTTAPGTCMFRGTPEYLFEVYKNRFHKIKRDASSPQQKKDIITYSLDANFARDDKMPPYSPELVQELQKIAEVVHVGGHLGATETAYLIDDSRLFVGVDNGVSQLCRSTSTPHILIQHIHDVERAFPREYHDYFKASSLEAAVELAKCVFSK
jgi:hypothetical protein